MNTFPAGYRPNPRYKPAFSYEDEWRELEGEFRILSAKRTAPDSYGSYLTIFRIKAPKLADPKEVLLCLIEHFTTGGCAHAHDCCGCRSTLVVKMGMANDKRAGRREWIVQQFTCFNY